MADGLVLGVDVGTTATKVAAFTADGTTVADTERDYPLRSPHAGWAEQDPDEIVDAVTDALAEVVAHASDGVVAIGLSTAMHTLIGLDDDRQPLTPSVTFADSRAWPQALALRDEGIDLYRATGTPMHPMAPLVKLRWFADERPGLAARVARWVSIKEHLLHRLCGTDVVDRSVASATGLLDLSSGTWHDEALAAAGVRAEQLGVPVPTTHVLDGLCADVARRIGLPTATPVVVGATDGVLANLGVGATVPGVAALTIGTSGAIRVTVRQPRTDPAMRTFCYALTDDRWVLGGAISNGGLALAWLRDHLMEDLDLDAVTALADDVPAGSDGVLVLPYLTGERAPRWSPLRGGVLFGLRVEHTRGHVVRATLEGVALQLRLVADALREADAGFDRVRVTGGFVASDVWLQIVADVLDTALEVPRVAEGAAYGAAMLARVGIGEVGDVDMAVGDLEIARTVTPDADRAARYDAVAERYAELVDRLEPLLRREAVGDIASLSVDANGDAWGGRPD